ncbi:MAG: SusC/RagA family TonB-linked outer membrane protein, partial [Saprospiraceae bacterium]|nr:SusC/RagA family TonB-linked outer membrane protein [Saprospiraceae bacterium]
MKKILLLFVFLAASSWMMAQRTVTGTVTDTGGDPLIGANVIALGTTVGTITDIDGKFTINMPAGNNTIVVSYIGYEDQTIDATGLSNVSIAMHEGTLLEEVVVTALGISRDEKSIGYSVQQISSNSIREANTVSAIDALAGSAAGVQVTSSNGAAGASSRIILRGQTSFNGDNQALIVVDGIRLDNSEFHTERSLGGVSNSNRGIDINPNDIASMSVLKGAAATALYGIEGARGVILITTKKGSKNQPLKVELSSSMGISNVTNITPLQTKYLQGSGGVWQGPDTGQSGSWGPSVDNAYWDGSDYKYDKNGRIIIVEDGVVPTGATKFVPYDNVADFFKTGYAFNNNLAFTGGQKFLGYRLSLGASNNYGITPNNKFDRYNAGLSLEGTGFDNKLTLGSTINYINSGGQRIQQGSNVSGVMLGLLRTPISFDNANGLENAADNVSSYQFPDNTQRNYRGGGGYDNPYWVVNNTPFNDNVNRLFGNISASYTFTPWVKISALFGTDVYTDNRVQRFEIGSRAYPAGRVIEDNYNYKHIDQFYRVSGNGYLNTNFSLGYDAGINLYSESLKNASITGDGLNFFGFPKIGNTSDQASLVSNSQLKTAGVFGTVDFGYKDYLYLTLTGRNDWSSTLINPNAEFDAGAISFFYPSVSLSLDLAEAFKISYLDYCKLRASYAEVGGGAPGAYSTSTAFILPTQNAGTVNDVNDGWTNGIGFPYSGVSGFVYSAVAGNPKLKPSKTKELELGADIRFLNNRVGLDLAYYKRKSIDQIIAINIPYSTGFQRAIVNSGELATVGGEIILSLTPVKTKDFEWNLISNFSKWKTTVESLPEGVNNQYLDGFTGTGVYNIAPLKDEDGNIIEKYEYGQLFGNPFQRVNTSEGTFDPDMPYNPDGALIIDDNPNSASYGFPMADPNQRIIGNPNPDYLLGITNNFSYNNLNLSFLIDIRKGGDIWNGTKG